MSSQFWKVKTNNLRNVSAILIGKVILINK